MKNCVGKIQGKMEEIIERVEKNKELLRDSVPMMRGDTPEEV